MLNGEKKQCENLQDADHQAVNFPNCYFLVYCWRTVCWTLFMEQMPINWKYLDWPFRQTKPLIDEMVSQTWRQDWERCLQICCLLCYILSVGWERLIHGFVLLFIIGSKSLTIKILFRYLKYCCHSGPAHKWIVECWPLSSCFPPPILNLCLIWNTVLWKMYTWWHLGWLFLGTADRGNPMVRTTNS